jgi:hypothetical protein
MQASTIPRGEAESLWGLSRRASPTVVRRSPPTTDHVLPSAIIQEPSQLTYRFSMQFSVEEAAIESVFESALGEVDRFERFSRGWDGYRAMPFSEDVLARARWLVLESYTHLSAMGAVPDLLTAGPASDGSVDVEFRFDRKRLFFTIYPEDDQVSVTAFEDGEAIEEIVPFGEAALARWLNWIAPSQFVPLYVASYFLHPEW